MPKRKAVPGTSREETGVYDGPMVNTIRNALEISPHRCMVCDGQYPYRPHTCEQCGDPMDFVPHICRACDPTPQRVRTLQQARRDIDDVHERLIYLGESLGPLLQGVDHPDDIWILIDTALRPYVERLLDVTRHLSEIESWR